MYHLHVLVLLEHYYTYFDIAFNKWGKKYLRDLKLITLSSRYKTDVQNRAKLRRSVASNHRPLGYEPSTFLYATLPLRY